MPMYEYDCPACGYFTALRPMAESALPCDCPVCEVSSMRVILSAPGLATMAGNTRSAIAANERSAHAPKTVAEYQDSKRHPKGCGCCGPAKAVQPTKANPHALKGKAAGRPWMISH
ncbi:FmdB family zinc ribbon protein [Pseudomonas syringae group genomosp. 3]|uniref:Regulatory protein n=2 Tax=Pseudomonas syringae pv. primulae TaxID=251707 RepID=A0A3M5TJQ4_9PSED|nr:zinc ribbon domain-containing protein [Pseudomonas syringae group genomosp. 3]RMR09499.1 Regulatory protein [Pseudomonas syringae pv. primulae]RMU33752.1 Regulatory protein [Pseudomonas syringae pv. primulae]